VWALGLGGYERHMEDRHVDREPTTRRSGAHGLRVVVAVIILVVLVALVVDNKDDTTVGYVFGDVETPLFVLIIAAAVIGALLGWVVSHWPRRHRDA
jgi:uncharacterized integral membrane protein